MRIRETLQEVLPQQRPLLTAPAAMTTTASADTARTPEVFTPSGPAFVARRKSAGLKPGGRGSTPLEGSGHRGRVDRRADNGVREAFDEEFASVEAGLRLTARAALRH
jgi:hypothetical protein